MHYSTSALQLATKRALPFVTAKSTVPVYEHFLLDGRGGTLKIAAFNYEGMCIIDTHAPCDDAMYLTVHAKTFSADIAAIVEPEVALTVKDNKLIIKTKQHTAKINILDGDEFVVGLYPDDFHAIDPAIVTALDLCAEAVNEKHSAVILTGVHIAANVDGKIYVFGTDGIRAARYTIDAEYATPFEVTVPKSSVQAIAKALTAPIELAVNDSVIAFRTEDGIFTSQLLDGKYPNVQSFFSRPKENYTTITMSGADLSSALKRAGIFVGMDNYVLINAFGDQLAISSDSYDKGAAEIVLDAQMDGDAHVAANFKMLSDFAALVNKGNAILQIGKPDEAIFMYGVDNFDYVLMPMQIKR